MKSFNEYVNEYRKQLARGDIQQAYRGLMDYIRGLKTHLQNKYPDYFVTSIYQGYMDMTYFSFFPQSLKRRKLKVGIVFVHEAMRFEVWLFGINKQVQTKYWKLFKESGWNKYHIVSTVKGFDGIVDAVLVENPCFNDLNALTKKIEKSTLKFIRDIESFLSKH
jgi:hypothetical protein